MKEEFKIALAQISCERANKTENISRMEKAIAKARKQRAGLVIFPELCLTGYTLKDQLFELAEQVPGESTQKLEKIARRTGMYIVFGIPEVSEKTQATLYNTAAIVGPEGFIGKYRKMYLPTHSVFDEKRYFRAGYQPAVFETSVGKVGIVICYDLFFPETTRLERLEGAQLIVCISASPATRRAFFETLTSARAIENSAFLAYVNLVGIEDGLQFWGGSRLVGPQGEILARAKCYEEDFIVGRVNYADIRSVEAFVPTLKDLRPELFDKLKQSAEKL